MTVLKVSAKSRPIATAGALANTIREEGRAEIQVIGPKAVNQAIKAIAIARGYLASSGIDLILVPSFADVTIDGEAKTAIKMLVRPRHPLPEFEAAGPQPQQVKPQPVAEMQPSASLEPPPEPPKAEEVPSPPQTV